MKKLFVAALILVACDEKPKADPTPSVAPSASAPAPVASSAAPLATTSAPASASATAMASASASATPAAKDGGAASPTGKTAGLKPASAHVDGKNFALDVASPGCRANEECAMTIKLVAGADYHVNKEYPYKFLASAAPGVTFLGKKDANTFAKDSGDFTEQGEKTATLTVRFKPAAAGEAKVAGTYKMSVCSADQCQIEQQPLSLSIPVL